MLTPQRNEWYAIRVKSNRERVTADALRGKGLEVLLPAHREYGWKGVLAREAPLFPGYLFCSFDVRHRLPVLTVPGVVHIVGFGSVPHPIDAVEMANVKALMEARLPVSRYPFPPVGHKIEIQSGPLRGIEGVILAHHGEDKLVVSVSLLQRSIAVAVEREWVTSIPQRLRASA
jgi:transcription antitermination factor NusG